MELTIEQALQQSVKAHKEGKLQDAERLYRAILKSQPNHADANHNLGVLAVSVNRADVALPLFKTALKANPKIVQFWVSYIDALMQEKRFKNAKRALEEAKDKCVSLERLNVLERQLATFTQENEAALPLRKKSKPLSQKQKKLDVRNKRKKKKGKNKRTNDPPQDELIRLLKYYHAKKYPDAEALAIRITKDFPEHQFAWKVLGILLAETDRESEALAATQRAADLSPKEAESYNNLGVNLQKLGKLDEAEANYNLAITLRPDYTEAHFNLGSCLNQRGRLQEAVESYNQVILLKPDHAAAHSNLGVTLAGLGSLDQSLVSYKKAIELKPDHAEAHVNLGNALKKIGRVDDAIASYNQAIALQPDFAEARINLGILLKELGRRDEAIACYLEAIALAPDHSDAYVNFGQAIKNVKFRSSNTKLYVPLTQLLIAGNFTRPRDVAGCILSLIKHDPLIKDLLHEPDIHRSLSDVIEIIRRLDKLPLLHHLMRICPIPDLLLEDLFVSVRRVLLINHNEVEGSRELIYFLSTLCLHCSVNEYVYPESDEEIRVVNELEKSIKKNIAESEQPEVTTILCLASYRPLVQYDWYKVLNVLDNLSDVRIRLIDEPSSEKLMGEDIAVSDEMRDVVSQKVRKQYEENPYPSWVKLGISPRSKTISEVCDDAGLHLYSESITNLAAPAILVAGCGTGQHSIETAARFSDCQVTAVDLSLSSLAFAKRKTAELGITNIEYLQSDILELDNLNQKFDIIESIGVLHHMDEPMVGWRVLADLLKPNGLMRIGLYSERARQRIVKVRKEISLLNIGTSNDDIRKFRRFLVESHDECHKPLTKLGDFFSLSEFRDLVFHVKEHLFTLPQISNCLNELGLKFCGFENTDAILDFRELHGDEADIYDLGLWHQYEERNPQAFAGMYQFWCQKP